MIWLTNDLSEISKIGDGAHASLKRLDYGIPYLTAKNIGKNGIDFSNIEYISEETYNKHFKEKSNALTKPCKNDILYSIIGSIGGVYVVQDEKIGISSSVAIFRADESIILSSYFAYFLRWRTFQAQVNAIKGGVAQGFMSLRKLGSISIVYPQDISYQKKIVNILTAYDKLIENNQKQIKLLEEAAQRLYKEWFVDLRFPGYENTKIVDGVPEGWSFCPIGDRYTTVLGGTPSRAKKDYWGGTIPWINSGEVNKDRITEASECISKLGLEKSSTKLMPIHTTVLAITGATLGQVSFTEIETCANQSVVGIYDENRTDSEFIHRTVSYYIADIIRTATGGAQQHINKDIVNAYKVLIPTADLINQFQQLIAPIYKKESDLFFQTLKLSEARDRLLPKLMSGELEV